MKPVTTAQAITAYRTLLKGAERSLAVIQERLKEFSREGTERTAVVRSLTRPVVKKIITAETLANAQGALDQTIEGTNIAMEQLEVTRAIIVAYRHRIEQLQGQADLRPQGC